MSGKIVLTGAKVGANFYLDDPSSLGGPWTIGQPYMLMAQPKEYQPKELNRLISLYEQGINDILADETGLGKTVQFLAPDVVLSLAVANQPYCEVDYPIDIH